MVLLIFWRSWLNWLKQNYRKESKQQIMSIGFVPALYFRRTSQMLRREHGSTPLVGSSRTTVFEFPMNEIAIDSLLFIPPERAPTGLYWCWNKSTSSRALKFRNGKRFGKLYLQSHHVPSELNYWKVTVNGTWKKPLLLTLHFWWQEK